MYCVTQGLRKKLSSRVNEGRKRVRYKIVKKNTSEGTGAWATDDMSALASGSCYNEPLAHCSLPKNWEIGVATRSEFSR